VVNPHRVPPIGRQAAQRLARQELSKAIYHRHSTSLVEVILQNLFRWLARLFRNANNAAPGGGWGLVVLTALVVVAIAVILARLGPVSRNRRAAKTSAPITRARTAREYRDSAKQLAAAGDYAAAICESVRAIAAELDERGILMPSVGRTADEFAREAGLALPGYAAGFRDAAKTFDEVRYGQRAAGQPAYEQVRDLDVRVRASAGRVSRAVGPSAVAVPAGRTP
jgi:hypothetical protein